MKGEWQNLGDINFIEYGGAYVRKAGEDECDFFKLVVVSEEEKYAFGGTVCWLSDHAEDLDVVAKDLGYENGKDLIDKYPELAVAELLDNYGYGVFEFSPHNKNGRGQYSMSYEDFRITDEEIKQWMSELGIPTERE